MSFLSDPALQKKLRSEKDRAWNLEMLANDHQIGEQDIEALYQYARFQYDCGNYSDATVCLHHYRSLCTNSEHSFSALWGKFSSDILMQDWDASIEALNSLKEIIDSKARARSRHAWPLHRDAPGTLGRGRAGGGS